MNCPFCNDDDFDLVGLKGHLLNDCEVFDGTETPNQEMRRKALERRSRYPHADEVEAYERGGTCV